MKPTGTQSPLPLSQDLPFQFRMWRIERIGWGAMLAILLAALAGFFGHGSIGKAVLNNQSFRLEYERFGRYHTPMNLRFDLDPHARKQGHITVWLSNQYLLNMRVAGTVPQAERTEVSADGLRFVFSTDEKQSVGMVIFHLHPDTVGPLTGSFALNDSQPVFFSQFIYP